MGVISLSFLGYQPWHVNPDMTAPLPLLVVSFGSLFISLTVETFFLLA